jgi:hypothetical protein
LYRKIAVDSFCVKVDWQKEKEIKDVAPKEIQTFFLKTCIVESQCEWL